MPQFWIAIFFIVLAIAQLFQSMKEIELPLPVYLVLGTILAISSNSSGKLSFSPAKQVILSANDKLSPVLTSVQSPLVTATEDRDLNH